MLARLLMIGFLSAVLVSCGGGGGGDSASSGTGGTVATTSITISNTSTLIPDISRTPNVGSGSTGAGFVTISGTISYERVPLSSTLGAGLDFSSIQTLPVRGTNVLALASDGTILASTVTDNSGNYSLSVAINTQVRIRVEARSLSSSGAIWDVAVGDNTNSSALYVLEGSLASSGVANSTRNLTATTGWTGSSYGGTRASAPFAILDSIYEAIQAVVAVDASVAMDNLDVFWSVNNSTARGNLSAGQIGSSFYSGDQIFVLGRENSDTDEFDEHVIVHEWGHYFEDNLSRSDSLGGLHTIGDRLDMRLALSEGFSNALSGIVTGDPVYRDSSGFQQGFDFQINVESNTNTNPGWFSESSVHSTLYDIFDSAADASDSVNLGFAAIYNAMTGTAYREQSTFITIFSLAQQIKTDNPGASTGIDTILAGQSIIVNDFLGTGETNDGGDANNLPVYKSATVGGGAVTICSSRDEGESNKLGNRQYIRLPVTSTGLRTITVVRISGLSASNPGITLYRDGNSLGTANSNTINQEVGVATLTPDDYIIEVFETTNINNTTSNAVDSDGGDVCFNVSVT